MLNHILPMGHLAKHLGPTALGCQGLSGFVALYTPGTPGRPNTLNKYTLTNHKETQKKPKQKQMKTTKNYNIKFNTFSTIIKRGSSVIQAVINHKLYIFT